MFLDGLTFVGEISGLLMHPEKCIIILPFGFNEEAVREQFLAQGLDSSAFKLCRNGKYLGIYVGPITQDVQWKAAVEKFRARVDKINKSSLPNQLVSSEFNMRAVPQKN